MGWEAVGLYDVITEWGGLVMHDCTCVQCYLRLEGLREASVGDTNVSLQKLHHGEGKGQLIRPLLHFCPRERVLNHELCQITHNLRGGSHLQRETEHARDRDKEREQKFKEAFFVFLSSWSPSIFEHIKNVWYVSKMCGMFKKKLCFKKSSFYKTIFPTSFQIKQTIFQSDVSMAGCALLNLIWVGWNFFISSTWIGEA